jgi:hypothetical protein
MTHVQSHRGPDDFGLWERQFPDGAYVGLGSRRLAILDLSPRGHMRSFIKQHRDGGQDWSMQIWQFLTLELWMRSLMDSSVKQIPTEVSSQAATA